MKKRIFAILLALTLALTLLPTAVFATGEDGAAEPQQEEVKPEVDPEQPEEPEQPEQPEQPEGQPEQPEAKPEEEKEAQEKQEEPAAQSAGEPVVLNGEGETPASVTTVDSAEALASALTNTAAAEIQLMEDITIDATLDVSRTVTLDLNGHVLEMNGNGRVITVSNGDLTLKDSAPDAEHGFTPNTDGLWVLDETSGTETINGGVITGGKVTVSGTTPVLGGGVFVAENGKFTMNGGNIAGCTADGTYSFGGGVFVTEKGTFTMNGGSIAGCTAVGTYSYGGGIRNEGTANLSGNAEIRDCHAKGYNTYGGGINAYGVLNINGNVKITGCSTAVTGTSDTMYINSGGVISGGMFDGSVESNGTISGGTFNGKVTNYGTITDGTFYGKVTNSGSITGGDFQAGIDGIPAFVTGSGTKDDPYQISTAEGLKWFRDVVNGANGQTQDLDACAVLTADIALDSNEAWTPIGYASDEHDDMKAYSGTFDGQGHTISGLNVDVAMSGLFGYIKNAAIKNLTVAGSVGGGNRCTAGGGIVGYAVGGAIENCGNLCAVNVGGSCPGGGIVGSASDLTITGCYNAGKIHKGDGMHGGGIVGVGTNVKIYDCYNVGEVEGNLCRLGGIVGMAIGPVSVYNCYNAGSVEVTSTAYEDPETHGIVGGGEGTVQIEKCYYLEGTREDAKATAMTAAQFADGTVLKLLKAGTHSGTNDPWDSVSKEWNGMVLPGFTWQSNNHTHTWGKWMSNDDDTHSRTCACGVTETGKCSGGTATCTEKATCSTCGTVYGSVRGHDWAAATCTTPKTCKVCKITEGTALGHTGGTATCTEKAVCSTCNQAYGEVDPNNHVGGEELRNKKDATCTEKGYTGDTYCKGCNTMIKAGAEINALDHDWGKWASNKDGTHTRVCSRDKSHTESGKCSGGKADCCHKAECTVCGGKYGNLDPDNHSDLKHFPAKRATTRAEGNIEYWYCSGCGKYYRDEAATKEITQKDTVIRKRRPSGDSTTTDDKTVKSVKTGDAGIALYVGMAALSLTGGAWLRRKKQ